MTLLVHLTNYGEFRKLIMGTNLRSELNKVYYRGKVYTCEQLSTQKLDFSLYARVYDDELVLLRTLQTYTTAIPVDDYLDLFAQLRFNGNTDTTGYESRSGKFMRVHN